MSQIAVLVILLGVAYLGGAFGAGRGPRFGMASGIEYIALGVVLGPHLLGVIQSSTLSGFEPLLFMALGWLATVMGIGHGVYQGAPVRWPVAVAGTVQALFTLVGTLVLIFFLSGVAGLEGSSAQMVALACGVVAAGSAYQAVDWATRGTSSSRSLSRLVGGLGNIDDLLPLLALAGLVLIHPPETTWGWPGWVLVLAGLSLGAVLGVTVAALFGVRLDRTELWPVLLGASLLVVGITLRLELPVLTPLFLLGACVALFSGHREMIRNLVVQTERPLLLPTLLLAGALVELPRSGGEWVLVFGAVASRVVFQFVGGLWISRFFDEARGRGVLLGQTLLPASGMSVAIGLAVYLDHPDGVGRVALLVSVVSTLTGELLGGRALRRLATFEQEEPEGPVAAIIPAEQDKTPVEGS